MTATKQRQQPAKTNGTKKSFRSFFRSKPGLAYMFLFGVPHGLLLREAPGKYLK